MIKYRKVDGWPLYRGQFVLNPSSTHYYTVEGAGNTEEETKQDVIKQITMMRDLLDEHLTRLGKPPDSPALFPTSSYPMIREPQVIPEFLSPQPFISVLINCVKVIRELVADDQVTYIVGNGNTAAGALGLVGSKTINFVGNTLINSSGYIDPLILKCLELTEVERYKS